MGSKLRIGIVGCGAIGTSLAQVICLDFKKDASLAAVYDIESSKSVKLSKDLCDDPQIAVGSLKELIHRSDLVIESAHARYSLQIAKSVINSGRDIMIMSVGGILENFEELVGLARKHRSKIYIPSGAISGIDALKAANLSDVKSVVLTTYKNPAAFKGVKYIEERNIQLNKIEKDTVLFSGTAREAVKHFPQNINVAAILSIAGLGQHKTQVRIIASPLAKRNIHQIEIDSEAGTIYTRTENVLHPDNPKTSFLAVLSAIATLKQILEPVRIGT